MSERERRERDLDAFFEESWDFKKRASVYYSIHQLCCSLGFGPMPKNAQTSLSNLGFTGSMDWDCLNPFLLIMF